MVIEDKIENHLKKKNGQATVREIAKALHCTNGEIFRAVDGCMNFILIIGYISYNGTDEMPYEGECIVKLVDHDSKIPIYNY